MPRSLAVDFTPLLRSAQRTDASANDSDGAIAALIPAGLGLSLSVNGTAPSGSVQGGGTDGAGLPGSGGDSLSSGTRGNSGTPGAGFGDDVYGNTHQAGPASILEIVTQPLNSVAVGSPFSMTVLVKDTAGNLADYNGPVTVAAQATSVAGFLAGTLTVTASHGVALLSGLTLLAPGTSDLGVTSDGLNEATTVNEITASGHPLAQLTVADQPPGSVLPGQPFGLSVAAVDPQNNVLTGFKGQVTLALGSNPAGATLGGTITTFAVNGVATFSGLTLDKLGAGYTIQASAEGLIPIASAPFDVFTVTVSLTPSATTFTVGEPIILTAQVTSSAPVPDGSVVFLDDASYGTVTLGSAPVDSSNGHATLGPLTLSAGSHALTAQYIATSLPLSNTSQPVNVTVSPPTLPPLTVTVNQAATQSDPTTSHNINFTVAFSEPVKAFDSSMLTLGGTAGATDALISVVGQNTYNVDVIGMIRSGTVTVTIPTGAVTGVDGQTNAASTSTDNVVTFNFVSHLQATGVPVTVPEGLTVTNALVATYPDSDGQPPESYSASIDWGDGTPPAAGTVALSPFTPNASSYYQVFGSHTYAAPGNYSLTVVVADLGGHMFTATTTATIGSSTPPATSTPTPTTTGNPIIITAPSTASTNADTSLTFSAGNTISVADAAAGPLTVTLVVSNGTLNLAGSSGLTFTAGTGSGDTSMTFSGALLDLNAALAGLSYTPVAAYTGPDTLGITASDGTNVATQSVSLTVSAVAPRTTTIDSLTPDSGPLGGTQVVLAGTNLDLVMTIAFGGLMATFSPLGAELLVNVPATASPGAVDVVVTSSSNTITLPNAFTYLANPVAPPTTSQQPTLSNAVSVNPAWANLAPGTQPPGSPAGTILGVNAFASLQAAIAATLPGGTITLAAGNYPESITLSQSIILHGSGSQTTTLRGNGTGVGLSVSGPGVVLSGLTVSGFGAPLIAGGGTTYLALNDVHFTGNTFGAAINGVATVLVIGGSGDETFFVRPGALALAGDNPISISGVQNLTVDGGGGSNRLVVYLNDVGTPDTVWLTSAGMARDQAPFRLWYRSTGGSFGDGVAVVLGDGPETVVVQGQPSGVPVTVYGQNGNTMFYVAVTASSAYSNLTLDGGAGNATLGVVDLSGGATLQNLVAQPGQGEVDVTYAGGAFSRILYQNLGQVLGDLPEVSSQNSG